MEQIAVVHNNDQLSFVDHADKVVINAQELGNSPASQTLDILFRQETHAEKLLYELSRQRQQYQQRKRKGRSRHL